MDSEAIALLTSQTEEKSDSHDTDKVEDAEPDPEEKDKGIGIKRTTTHLIGEAKTLRRKLDDQVQVTGQVLDQFRDEKYSKGECLCFFSLLIVFTVMAVLARGGETSFTQTITIRQSLIERDEFLPWNNQGEKTFSDASTIEDIYRYLETVAVPFLLKPDDAFYVQAQQALLGGLRLKQVHFTH